MRSRVVAVDIGVLRRRRETRRLGGHREKARVGEGAVRFLRKSFGAVILVISGQSRMMYQSLVPKAGGNNLC
jgi:hypothetical protein